MERLHVSLCHLGDYYGLPGEIVAKAEEAASGVAASSLDVSFDRALSFTGRARNRPFVLRSKDGAAAIESFQRRLCAEMTMCGLGKFARPYTPHMTLLYDSAEVAEHAIDPVSWTAGEFRLVHSMLGQTRHVTLGSWSLGEGQVAQAKLEPAI